MKEKIKTKTKKEVTITVEGQQFNENDIRTLVGWSALTLVNPSDMEMMMIKLMLKSDVTKLLMDKKVIGRDEKKK